MKIKEAVNKFISHSKHSQNTILTLIEYDESKSIEENAKKIGLSIGGMRQVAIRYGLDYKKTYMNYGAYKLKPKNGVNQIIKFRKAGLTLEQIGKIFNVTKQTISYILSKRKKS